MGNIKDITKSLKKNLFIESYDDDYDTKRDDSPWESLYMAHFSGINAAARNMGIDINSAKLINTKRPNMKVDDILDVSGGKHQWYSVGTAWLDWIRPNMPEWLAPCTYAIVLDKPLVLSDRPNTISFEKKYVIDPNRPKDIAIDWKKLYKDGIGAIEFSPYDRNFSDNLFIHSWYNSIDMSSGAIVNKKCIKKIVKLYDGTDDFNDAGVKI